VATLIEFISGACVGVCIGASGLFAIAAHLSNKAAKAKPTEQPQGIAATSVSVNGGNVTMDAWHARMLESVLKHYEAQA
jgi:hypothetical protein